MHQQSLPTIPLCTEETQTATRIALMNPCTRKGNYFLVHKNKMTMSSQNRHQSFKDCPRFCSSILKSQKQQRQRYWWWWSNVSNIGCNKRGTSVRPTVFGLQLSHHVVVSLVKVTCLVLAFTIDSCFFVISACLRFIGLGGQTFVQNSIDFDWQEQRKSFWVLSETAKVIS